MNIRSKTVGINAAFLQEVKEDNVHLQELLAAASKVLVTDLADAIQPRALSELLDQIRDQLATHFALEEAVGYLDDVVAATPRFCEKAYALRAEHDTLYLTISVLAEDAQTMLSARGRPNIALLVNRFRGFCRNLKNHELAENELIMDSLYDDLGVGD